MDCTLGSCRGAAVQELGRKLLELGQEAETRAPWSPRGIKGTLQSSGTPGPSAWAAASWPRTSQSAAAAHRPPPTAFWELRGGNRWRPRRPARGAASRGEHPFSPSSSQGTGSPNTSPEPARREHALQPLSLEAVWRGPTRPGKPAPPGVQAGAGAGAGALWNQTTARGRAPRDPRLHAHGLSLSRAAVLLS